ncbi:MAG TPA: PAS domain S-box protein [Deltaproteobacteria bacterium]|nr:PAS domain S-box protein [Deltaproteobacteria bacterium]
MKNEKLFWGGLLFVSLLFITVFSYFFMQMIFPFHVDQMKKRATETVDHMQSVMPHLEPAARQAYLERIAAKTEDLSYLLLMDMNGKALAHSNPVRIGMVFDEPGIRESIRTNRRIVQTYVRDADNPSSPYHNEKTIDIIGPYYSADGQIAGAVNVGISLNAVERIKSRYITMSAATTALWLLFVSGLAVSHIRTMSLKRKADKALSASERRLFRAISATSDAIWEWDLSSKDSYYSPRWYQMLGYEDQAFKMDGEQWQELCHPDDLTRRNENVRLAISSKGEKAYSCEFRMHHKDGHWLWILGRGNVVEFDDNSNPLLMSGTNTDISGRKAGEERLRESEARYRSIIENIQDVYYRTDKDGKLIIVSPSGVTLLGYESPEELLGRHNAAFWLYPSERSAMLDILHKQGAVRDYEVVLKKKDGSPVNVSTSSTFWRDHNGEIQGVEGIFRDTTERKHAEKAALELQEELMQARKLEAVGRLAGGVAHDFNNMLVVIMGRTELAMIKLPNEHPIQSDLKEILGAAERSAELTRHLLAFARKQAIEPRQLDLNEAVAATLQMHRRLIGEEIELEWRPEPSPLLVIMDPGQLDQILMNLCVNARDAIAGTGKIVISTSCRHLDNTIGTMHTDCQPGEYATLSISDNGCGMDKQVLDHIFEPFYTTKEIGKGTGLGLATVFGTVKQNNGVIDVTSAVGAGTTFTIYLPLSSENAEHPQDSADNHLLQGKGETILLVEDEIAILELGRLILTELNYNVLAANTPEEAITMATNHQGKIDLLITDVIMPKMNGKELARQISQLCPGTRCIYMSGYTADIIDRHGILDDGLDFIHKPFNIQQLAHKVYEVLHSS